MKLAIQIPCLNEAETLPAVLKDIPTTVPGFDAVEVIVIDDGSSDGTADVARAHGVATVIRHRATRGLAEAFRSGIDYGLTHGADVIVNTDGDNQYPQGDIPRLVEPITSGRADLAIGDRRTNTIEHFSRSKKLLQQLGNKIVSLVAGRHVPDAGSGFRAYSRVAALKLNLVTKYSYTMETIIQAGYKQLATEFVPITTNAKTRESRLFRSTPEHVTKSAAAIIRSLLMYRPYSFFTPLGLLFLAGGLTPFIRFLIARLNDMSVDFIQSLLVGVFLLTASFLAFVLGVIADLIKINRQLIEDGLALQKAHQDRQSLSELDRD